MIEAIKEIGEYALEKEGLTSSAFLNGICPKIPETIPNEKDKNRPFEQHVIFLNFNTETKKIELDFEVVNAGGKDSSKEYLWIGNAKGSKEQIFFTTDNIIYLFTKTLPSIKERVEGDLKRDIEEILDNFFIKEEEGYIINPSKFKFLEEKVEDTKNRLTAIKDRIAQANTKKDVSEITKDLKKIYKEIEIKQDIPIVNNIEKVKEEVTARCNELIESIKEKLIEYYKTDIMDRAKNKGKKRGSLLTNDWLSTKSLLEDNVAIYTPKFNGDLLIKNKMYRDMAYYEKIETLFSENGSYKDNFQKGICSICGKDDVPTTSNATNLDFKFYMTDKLGFSSNLDGRFTKNFNICKGCYQYLMIGENFIDNSLRTRIGGLNCYVIPHFIFKIKNLDIERFSSYINSSTNSIANLGNLKKFQGELERFRENDTVKNNFIINYLFYHKPAGSSEFKILKLVKDVPPSRLDFIRKKEEEIINLVDDKYGGNRSFKIDLEQIWGGIPIKKEEKGSYSGFSRYLDILDAVFSDKKVDYNFLINQFTETIRIIKFEREGYNILTKTNFRDKILQLNFLLLFFKKLDLLGGKNMNEVNKSAKEMEDFLPKEILNYWKDMGIYENACRKTLFLLGYLVGEIGSAQSAKEIKNKPILNKINFQGMGPEKLIRLSNDVLEKLRQNDKLRYNENIYSVFKLELDNNIAKWNLSNQENVFYVLSGYAFSNYINWARYVKSIEENIKQKEDEIQGERKRGSDVSEQEGLLNKAKELFYGEEKDYRGAKEILKSIKMKEVQNE